MQLSIILFFFVSGACAKDGVNQPTEMPVQAAEHSESPPMHAEYQKPAKEELEGGDQPYDGFCADDIYSQYLRQKYIDSKPSSKNGPRRISTELSQLGSRGLFYSRSILSGKPASRFGSLPVVTTPGVDAWVHYYSTRGRDLFIKWLVRAESLQEMVQLELRESGVPEELFYLAMIESGFSNTASSRARATGAWQLMKPTAKHLGMRMDRWVDERRDPVKATRVAARYLKELYARFGDWYLAMAAYNAGPGRISRALKRARVRDYWTLAKTNYISRETKQYVPKVLAALIINSDVGVHGFNVTKDTVKKAEFTSVPVRVPTPLAPLAQKLGLSLSDLKIINPELLRDTTPPNLTRPYMLRLPSELVNLFYQIEAETLPGSPGSCCRQPVAPPISEKIADSAGRG